MLFVMRVDDTEAHFRMLVSQVRDYAIFSTDVEGRATTWNEGVCAVLGYERDEFLGSHAELIYLADDVATGIPQRELATAAEKGTADNDRWMRRKGGEAFFATGRTTRISDASGRCVGFTKVMRDDTLRILAEERLRQSEERYRLLFDAIDAGFCIVEVSFDADGTAKDYVFVAVNPAFARQTGLHDVLGRSMRELAPAHEEHWFQLYGSVAKTGTPQRVESPAAALGNRWFDVYAFRIDAPERHHVAVLFSDITPRKHAQMASARLASLVEHSADAILGLDVQGRIKTWNPAAHVLFGYSAEEIIGRHCSTLAPSDRRDQVSHFMTRLLQGEPIRVETEAVCKSGRILPVLLTAGPVREAGEIVAISASLLDISEQRRMQSALRAEDRRKDEFLATLAHELRNPLAPLRTGLQLARMMNRGDDTLRQLIGMMDRQLCHLVRLVDDLLDVGRIRSGKVELRMNVVPILSVVEASIEASASIVAERNHRLVVHRPEVELEVCGDADRLAQVFSNLLSNAAKYTEPGGAIDVDVRREGPNAVVTVRDTGIGIAKGDLHRVFDLFSQVREHQPHSQGGLGIGLALVRRFVELHGGSIEAYSEGPCRGSAFHVRLPLAPLPPGDARDTSESELRVLLADDSLESASFLAQHLRSRGHDVQVAHDGFEAVQFARARLPDVALLDLGMTGLDGFQAARDIRALPGGDRVLLVALTAWSRESDRERGVAAGFDRQLVKPVQAPAIARLLAELRSPASA